MRLFAPEGRLAPSLALYSLLTLTIIGPSLSDDYEAQAPGRALLDGPDFRVTTRVSILRPGSLIMTSEEIITEEFYSNRQRRALLELHRVDPESGEQADLHSVYHYQSGQLVQNPMYAKRKCQPVTNEQLARALFGKLKMTNKWLRERSDVPDYVIGLARWMFIIDHDRDNLFKKAYTLAMEIRNHQTIMYELTTSVDDQFGFDGKLKIYYAETREHYDGFDLPMRIHFFDRDLGMILIDFSFVGPLPDDMIGETNALYPLDLFALPLGLNCSEKMQPAYKIGWRLAPVEVVSFQADIYKHDRSGRRQTSISRRFVAYDNYAGAMRSDAIAPVAYSSTIINLWNGKKYNILTEDVEDDKKVSRRQCVISKTDIDRTLLPFKDLVFMGLASVRGVDCFAFEHITDRLPRTLFPLMTYTSLDGKEETIFGRDPRTYSVVYYFAISSQLPANQKLFDSVLPPGPLMRIDVYNKDLIEYHVDVYEYVNQLVAAPNGDRQEELFAIKDRCTSGELGADGYANLALELAYKPSREKPRTSSEVMDILESPHLRNKAILRALAVGSTGVLTKLSDIQTNLRLSSSGQLEIFVKARLNSPDLFESQVKQIGWSALRVEPTGVKTIEECFQWAAHAQLPSAPILFVSCASSCSLDPNVVVEYEQDGKTIKTVSSEIYLPDPNRSSSRSCPTMLIESNPRKQNKNSFITLLRTKFNWIRSDLDGKILRLLMPNQGSADISLDDLLFEVTKIDINNDRWSLGLGPDKAHLADGQSFFKLPLSGFAEAIDGLGLTEASGQLQQAKQPESSSKNDDDDDDDSPVMNYKICHSICIADLDCRSFSICITRQGVECIISGIDFRDRTLLKDIEDRLEANDQSKNKSTSQRRRTITVANPVLTKRKELETGGDDEDPASILADIELKIDFRCKLYKRNALEMFEKKEPVLLRLKNSYFTAVDSQEECAEICIRNNMRFFKKMAQTKLELLQNNEQELKDEELVSRIRKEYNMNLYTWCTAISFISTSSPDFKKQAQTFIEPMKLAKAGLCAKSRAPGIEFDVTPETTKDPAPSKEPKVAERIGPKLSFESFEFLYTNLFDVQYGTRVDTKIDRKKTFPDAYQTLVYYTTNPEICARNCFLQTSGLRPWCKSFDFVEIRSSNTKSLSRTALTRYCQYHTMSLAEIKLSNMAEYIKSDSTEQVTEAHRIIVRSWHYESRQLYTLQDTVQTEMVLVKSERNLLDDIRDYRLNALGVITIFVAAIFFATVIVVLHGDSIVERFSTPLSNARRDSISNPSRSFLSSLVPSSSSNIRHKRFVAGDQDLPSIPELNAI